MALFLNKWGDIRGKVADLVFSANAGGAYIRSKVTPMNPMTAKQMAARARFAQYAAQYSTGLTDSQREAWQQLAQTVPYNNIFGESKNLNGLSMFVKVNTLLDQCEQTALDDAPNNLQVRPLTLTATAFPGISSPTWTIDIAPTLSATELMLVYHTPCLNQAVNFVKNLYRFGGFVSGPIALPFEVNYDTTIGPLIVGQKVHARFVRMNIETGGVTLGVPVVSTVTA